MGYTSRDEIIIVHAALGGILGMIIWPLSAVLGRYLRSYHSKWVRIHYIVAGIIALPVLIVVFSLGRAHKQGDPDNWTTTHFRLGLVLLLMGLLQTIYGTVLHQERFKAPITGWKSIIRYGHPIVGFTIVILGFVQVYTGFGQWGKPGMIPHGIVIAWGVLTAFWVILYLAGMALLPRQWRDRKATMTSAKSDVYDVGDGRRSSVAPLSRPSGDA